MGTEVRLELLKLCHRNDRSPEQVIAQAKAYEDFVMGELEAKAEPSAAEIPGPQEKRGPGRPKKSVGNADILS